MYLSKKKLAVACFLAVTNMMYIGGVQASETDGQNDELQSYSLDEFVVTASRTENKLVDTPANVSVINAEQIESRHYQDVAEALKDVPGVNVMDNGTGAFEKKVVLNGDERVLVLVDGRRVNIDMGTMSRSSFDLNQLPDPSLIERIEVVKGHGGALYGSDAVGGVINIITKKADHNYGKVSMGFGSNQSRDMKAMYTIKENKTGVTVAASKYKQGYYKYKDAADSNTKRWPGDTSYENEKVSLKIDQELTDTTNLSVGYDFSKFSGTNPSSVTSYWPNVVDKKTNNFNIKYDWLLNDKDQGYVQVYHNRYEYYNAGGMEEKDTGFDVQQAITTSDTNKLVVGASYRKATAFNEIYYTEENDINNKALFISDQWDFAPTWSLNAGARYDKHSTAGSETTLSAGLNKKFDENSHAYFNWGQVFKAPTIDDLYYYSDQYQYFGNPNLKAETGDTWTLGYGTKINDRTTVNASYFQSDLDDAIAWDYSNQPVYVRNIHKQKKNGMELSITHELNDNVDLEASYTYVRVRNDVNDGKGFVRDLNYMPNIYRFGVRYHDDQWKADLFLRAGSGASATKYVDSSYITLDMAVSYQAAKNLSFYAKGYNLTNEAYAEQGGVYNGSYSYPAQSRRFIVGAEYTF